MIQISSNYLQNSGGENYFKNLPSELIHLIWRGFDPKSLYRAGGVCKEWSQLFKSKSTGSLMKKLCFFIWHKELYTAQQSYYSKFSNWRDMMKMRPFVKFDGIYVCKMMYRRTGLSETSMNHPVHEVVSYRYLKFNRDKTAMSLITIMNPKRVLPKFKELL